MLLKLRQANCGVIRSGFVLPGFVVIIGGCFQVIPPPDNGGNSGNYNNTTDPTNMGATYVGSAACSACHSGIAEHHELHGHSQILKQIEGQPPEYPTLDRAGVPNPPPGISWFDVSFVIGGYTRRANFVDTEGYILTTGPEGIETQWNLESASNDLVAQFTDYGPEAAVPQPYDSSCFQCHTTGHSTQDAQFPRFEENRPGIIGTWYEAGVQCEACHGPGSNHVPNPQARDIFVGVGAENCGKCHTQGDDPSVITASGGYISPYGQWGELLASGGHANMSCTTCHDPHSGTNYDRENAIRNECTSCHQDHNMAIHEGFTFVRDDYTEALSCVSCHMPLATHSATTASAAVVGPVGRSADIRTHIFRINTNPVDYSAFFNSAGAAVAKDGQGRASVTLDFVCFRCHNGIGNAGEIDSLDLASGVADGMHSIVRPEGKSIVRSED